MDDDDVDFVNDFRFTLLLPPDSTFLSLALELGGVGDDVELVETLVEVVVVGVVAGAAVMTGNCDEANVPAAAAAAATFADTKRTPLVDEEGTYPGVVIVFVVDVVAAADAVVE